MKIFQGYYPYDRLALVVDSENHKALELVWLSSRWGVYTFREGKWLEEIPKQFKVKKRAYAHLDSSDFWEIFQLFTDHSGPGFLEDYKKFQINYEFEFHEMFDLSMDKDGLRDPYEIYRWINEFQDASPVELEGEKCERAKYYGYFVAEIIEPEERRKHYELEILNRRRRKVEEFVEEKLFWIEGLPTLNQYAVDVFEHAEQRHKLQEVGQDFEDEWPYLQENRKFLRYMHGGERMSVNEVEDSAKFFQRLVISNLWPLSESLLNHIHRIQE